MSDMRKVVTSTADDGSFVVHVQYGASVGVGRTIEGAAFAALADIDRLMALAFQERLIILDFLDQQKKTSEVSA